MKISTDGNNGCTYTITAPVRPAHVMDLAYVDINEVGHHEKDVSAMVMLQDLHGDQAYGASTLGYPELRQAVADLGGRADAKQLSAYFLEKNGQPTATEYCDGKETRADHYNVIAHPTVPPGIPHPVVGLAFSLTDHGLNIEYLVQKRTPIIRDNQIAILDNDCNGKPEPAHDSLLTMSIKHDASRQLFIGNMISYDKLHQAVQEAGGSVSEQELYKRLTPLVTQPGSDMQVSHITASPDPLAQIERPVEKTFKLDADGGLFVEYQLGDKVSFRGGWEDPTR